MKASTQSYKFFLCTHTYLSKQVYKLCPNR
nr:MAG TPA: hypothetical protein [Caudoviricetes sp.]